MNADAAHGADPSSVGVAVSRESDVARVVGAATHFCHRHALTPLLAAHVATAASELANNLWMHSTRGGVIHLRMVHEQGRHGVELVAVDDGPGIADVARAMTDGYSTGGSLGCGLPGVQRLMDSFDISSAPGKGTCVTARKWLAAGR